MSRQQSELNKGEEHALGDTAVLTRVDKAIGWARKFSIFPYPFATACCSRVDVRGLLAASALEGDAAHV